MSARCFKCQDDIAIVSTREGGTKAYCRTCFLDNYHKNVRDAFFRQCRIPPNKTVILAVSGGINSMAMMHSLGLLRVQNITRGGAGKIDFDLHVLHLTGDDADDDGYCARTTRMIHKACTSVAPVDHVPQATTTKRRVEGKKMQLKDEGSRPVLTTPLYEAERVHIKKLSEFLPPYENLRETFFGAESVSANPLQSVAMAEDLVARLRMKAIVAAATLVAGEIEQKKQQSSSDLNKENGFILLFGDSAVHSGVEALYQLVRGRGQSILDHCGFRGSLFGNTVLVRRPMRSSLPKENLFYCRIEGLPTTWTPVPIPQESDLSADRTHRLLLQFCIASATVHRNLVHNLVQAIKRHYAGTPLAVISHKQKSSLHSLLEQFVLTLSDGSYRSAVFNILHSVDKMLANSSADEMNANFAQKRFGPKNASAFAVVGNNDHPSSSVVAVEQQTDSASTTSPSHCSFCGGIDSILPQSSKLTWHWCRSCRQILRPVFESRTEIANNETAAQELTASGNELLPFLTQYEFDRPENNFVKMTREQIRSEIAEFLLDSEDS